MSKVFITIFSGIFIGAALYEFFNRTKPELMSELEDFAAHKIDDALGVHPQSHKSH